MSDREDQFRALYLAERITHQRTWYSDRTAEYRSAHRQAMVVRNLLLLAAAVAGVIAQATAGDARASWAVVAAFLGAFAGTVTAYDALIGFPQLEKLFRDAAHNLEEAGIDWRQPGAETAREVDRVEWIFRSERGQWGQLVVKSAEATRAAAEGKGDEAPGEKPAGGG